MQTKNRICYIVWATIALCCACEKEAPQDNLNAEIAFGTDVLPSTKSTLIDNATGLTEVKVWGDCSVDNAAATHVLQGVTLSRTGSVWDYSPHAKWQRTGTSINYDFLALATGYTGVTPSPVAAADIHNPSATSVKVFYNTKTDDYDLMAAGVSRSYSQSSVDHSKVIFNMKHQLSAVKFTVNNNSDFQMREVSYKVTGLFKSGACTYAKSGSAWTGTWGALSKAAAEEFFNTSVATINSETSASSAFFFAIPQTVFFGSGAADNAKLTISFKLQGSDAVRSYTLDLIDNANPANATDTWEPGKKYTYNINFTLNSDLILTVKTTDWDTIEAETPGIILP